MPAHAASGDPSQSASLSKEESLGIVEGWLRNAPQLTFKQVRRDAKNLGFAITPRQFSLAKKALGITGAAPRPDTPRTHARGGAMNGSDVVAKTPLMNFIVEFLRGQPEATYKEVQAAGTAANFAVAPINYGNARRMLGMAPKSKPGRPAGRRRLRQTAEPAETSSAPMTAAGGGRGRRGRKRKLDFGNLSNLVAELQDVVSERDRLLAALDQIASIIRNV